jgi:hypothetical protein
MTNLPADPSGPDVPGSGSAGPTGMRASDSDRDRVAEVLREAAAEGRLSLDELDERLDVLYKTRTYAELEPITADLPEAGTSPAPAPAARSSAAYPPDRYGGHPSGSVAVAVMSGFSRKGNWVAPKEMTAIAIMGGGEIDLRDARFAEPTITIHAITIMGGIQITVPEDAHVQVNGVGFMGAFDDSRADGEGGPGGPHIIINGFAFWGGVAVERKPSRRSRKAVDSKRQGELGS